MILLPTVALKSEKNVEAVFWCISSQNAVNQSSLVSAKTYAQRTLGPTTQT